MTCDSPTPLSRRDRLRALRPFFIAFLLLEGTIFINSKLRPERNSPLAYVIAVGIFLFLSAMIFMIVRFTAKQRDEFQRKLLIEATLWSIAAMLAVTTLWGCLEEFAGIPHMPILVNFPIFIVLLAAFKVTLFRRNKALPE